MINETNILRLRETERQTDTEQPVRQPDTSSTTTRAREETPVDGLMLYAKRAGLPDTPAMRAYNLRLLDDGFELGVLWAVMDETMMAPRPTWHYYAAIIRRLQREQCRTKMAWDVRQVYHRLEADGYQPRGPLDDAH